MVTGTQISHLPTGTIDNLQAVFPLSIGMPTGTQTIRASLAQLASQAMATQFQPSGTSVSEKYVITPSISSGGLAVAIKYIDGGNPSSSHPLPFRVGDTEYALTSSASYTKASGTNWHGAGGAMFAAKDIDFFMYAIGESGASAGLKFGHSRIPFARTMGDFVNTTTNEKYIAGNWTNFNSSDPVRNIGRFRARLSASPYVWSMPSGTVINYPFYETEWLDYLPTYSADGSMTFGSVSTTLAIYQIRNRLQEIKADFNGTTAGTASNAIHFTPPFTPVFAAGIAYGTAYVLDAGTASAGYWRIGASLPPALTAIQVLKADESNFGLGASRYTRGSIILPI